MAPIIKKYICVKSLTLSDRSVWDSAYGTPLAVGNDKRNRYTSLLHFDIPPLPENAGVDYAVLHIYIIGKNCGEKTAMAIRPFEDRAYPSEERRYTDRPYPCGACGKEGWTSVDISELVGRWHWQGGRTLSMELFGQETMSPPIKIIGKGPLYNLAPKIEIAFSVPEEKVHQCIFSCECACKTVDVAEMCKKFCFDGERFTSPVDVRRIIQGSFFIDNWGEETLEVTAQVSADGCRWVDDAGVVVEKGETGILVAKYYGKYYRLRLHTGGEGRASVRFIMQEHK